MDHGGNAGQMVMIRSALLWVLVAFGLIVPTSHAMAQDCGGAGRACETPLGKYFVAQPVETFATPRRAVVFLHGAGGGGDMVLDPASYLQAFVRAGYVLIGPQGLMREDARFGAGWSFRPDAPQMRDEAGFIQGVIEDATRRFNIDRGQVLLAGFSIGGSMVWSLACQKPGLALAYTALAGGFWRPHPVDCAGPINLLHSHGWADMTVPLEGRLLRGGAMQQGDIFEGLLLWRKVNDCRALKPDAVSIFGSFWLRQWTTCESGRTLTLALHAGGHDDVPKDWANMVVTWFEGLRPKP